jgi:FkbM family methyltransferase
VAFEPCLENWKALAENAHLNKLEGSVVLERMAVGASCGTVPLYGSDRRGIGTNSVIRPPALLHGDSESTLVGCVSLDEYCKESKLWPNVIKLDVEGAEMQVLQGMVQVLSYPSLTTVAVELHNFRSLCGCPFTASMRAHGFQVAWECRRGMEMQIIFTRARSLSESHRN